MRGWVVAVVALAGCAPSPETLGLFCESCVSVASVSGNGGAGGEAGEGGGGEGGQGGEASTSTSTATSSSSGGGGAGGNAGDGGGGAGGGITAPAIVYLTTDHPTNLACDGASIYWTESATGNVRRAGLDGEAPTTIADSAAVGAMAMRVFGGQLAMAKGGNSGRVELLSLSGQIQQLASAPGIVSFEVYSQPYWADGDSISSTPGDVVSTFGPASAFATDHGSVYWASINTRSVQRTQVSSGQTEEFARIDGSVYRSSMKTSGGHLYVGTTAGIVGIDLGSGVSTSYGSSPVPHVVGTSDSAAWVEAQADPHRVMVLDPGSGRPVELGSSPQIDSIAYCAGRVYWASYYGEIWYAPTPSR